MKHCLHMSPLQIHLVGCTSYIPHHGLSTFLPSSLFWLPMNTTPLMSLWHSISLVGSFSITIHWPTTGSCVKETEEPESGSLCFLSLKVRLMALFPMNMNGPSQFPNLGSACLRRKTSRGLSMGVWNSGEECLYFLIQWCMEIVFVTLPSEISCVFSALYSIFVQVLRCFILIWETSLRVYLFYIEVKQSRVRSAQVWCVFSQA